jgi:hypothetical protein
MRIGIPWWVKQTKRSVSGASKQRATKRKIKFLLWQYVSRKVMPLYFFPKVSGVSCPHKVTVNIMIHVMTPEDQHEKHT